MSDVKYFHTRATEVAWTLKEESHALGTPFHSVWSREMINLNPDVWEIKLTSNQVVPAHCFDAQAVQIFTSGSVSIEGEGECGEGDVRWAEGGVHSGAWKASPLGARFYLVGMEGAPTAQKADSAQGSKSSGKWQCNNRKDLPWSEVGDGIHVAPPGRICPLCPGGPSVMWMELDPGCVAAAHSHPGNIIYIVVEGEMSIPGEGLYASGDLRWALKDYNYNQEEMGPTGTTLIGIQKGAFEADWTV